MRTNVMRDEIAARLRSFIEENFLYMRPEFELDHEDSLMGSGIVDSMGVMEVVEFLETEFGVRINDEDITEEKLGSLNRITDYVMSCAQPTNIQ